MATVSIERLHVDLQYIWVQTGNVLIWSVESAPIATYRQASREKHKKISQLPARR
jgi:hypothetical protein